MKRTRSPSSTKIAFFAVSALCALLVWIYVGRRTRDPSRPEAFRPPAVPLLTIDPYFSLWSMADKLTREFPRHWTGNNHSLTGLIRVDGKAYRFIGPQPEDVPAST